MKDRYSPEEVAQLVETGDAKVHQPDKGENPQRLSAEEVEKMMASGDAKKVDDSYYKGIADSPTMDALRNGILLGYGPQFEAAVDYLVGHATGHGDLVDPYTVRRDRAIKRYEKHKKLNPKTWAVGNVAGGVLGSIPAAGLTAVKGATALQKMASAGKVGAGYGALSNPGDTEGELSGLQLGERARNAALGAATGAATQGALSGLGKGIGASREAKKKIGEYIKANTGRKADAAEIEAAAKALGIKATPGMTSSSKGVVQPLESSLEQSPGLGGHLVRRQTDKVRKGLESAVDDVTEASTGSMTPFEVGEKIKNLIIADTGEKLGPSTMVMDDLVQKFGQMPAKEKSLGIVANNLRKLPEVKLRPKAPFASTINNLADDLANVKTLSDVRTLRQTVGDQLGQARISGDTATAKVLSQAYKKLSNLEHRTLKQGIVDTARGKLPKGVLTKGDKPVELFHGTPKAFGSGKLDPSKAGKNFDFDDEIRASFLTDSPEMASNYAGWATMSQKGNSATALYPYYLKSRKPPMVQKMMQDGSDEIIPVDYLANEGSDIAKEFQKTGVAGFGYSGKNVPKQFKDSTEFVVADPEKSLIPMFSKEGEKIRKAFQKFVEGKKLAADELAALKTANKKYSEGMRDIEKFSEIAGIRRSANPNQFTKNVESIPSETLYKRFGNPNDMRRMSLMKEKFPEGFEAIRQRKLMEFFDKSSMPDGSVSARKLINQTKKLPSDAKGMIFGENTGKLGNIETVTQSLPNMVGPSGTPRGLSFYDYANPIMHAKDLGRYAAYKGLTSEAGKKLGDKWANINTSTTIQNKLSEQGRMAGMMGLQREALQQNFDSPILRNEKLFNLIEKNPRLIDGIKNEKLKEKLKEYVEGRPSFVKEKVDEQEARDQYIEGN